VEAQDPNPRSPWTDWKIAALIALPVFVGTMWYGIAHDFHDLALFAIAMGLASLGIGGKVVHIVRSWQAWRAQSRRDLDG
jgi:hypothetical protein